MTTHLLDNTIWHALGTAHAEFAQAHGGARRYQQDVSSLCAVRDADDPCERPPHHRRSPYRAGRGGRRGSGYLPFLVEELGQFDGANFLLECRCRPGLGLAFERCRQSALKDRYRRPHAGGGQADHGRGRHEHRRQNGAQEKLTAEWIDHCLVNLGAREMQRI